MSSASLNTLYEAALARILNTRQLLEQDKDVDLTGLDGEVAALCAQINDLPAEERDTYGEKLQHLMAELKIVSELLQKQHAKIKQQLEALGQKRQAMQAYTNAVHLTPNKKDDDTKEGE